jgi:hypothetical protein
VVENELGGTAMMQRTTIKLQSDQMSLVAMTVVAVFSLSPSPAMADPAPCPYVTNVGFEIDVISDCEKLIIERGASGSVSVINSDITAPEYSVAVRIEGTVSEFLIDKDSSLSTGDGGNGFQVGDRAVVSYVRNNGLIEAPGEFGYGVAISGNVGTFDNYGSIIGGKYGFLLSNSTGRLAELTNFGTIVGTVADIYVTTSPYFGTLNNAQGTRADESALRYNGELPEFYNMIVSSGGYGKLQGVQVENDYG